jgi:acylphosphatase
VAARTARSVTDPEERRRVAAVVRGRVQGVGFRWFVQRTAAGLGLDGWVANRPDGSVELVAEGGAHAVDQLLAAARRGPSGAQVREVEVRREQPAGLSGGFGIRSGGHAGD